MSSGRSRWPVLLAGFLLFGCAGNAPQDDRTAPEQLPMFGGADRNADPLAKQQDRVFIDKASREFGSRDKASQLYIDQAIRLYSVGNYALSMKRFNQAWLLTPQSPIPFWGFAIIFHDEGDNCGAREMIERALELGMSNPIQLADAGRIVTLCALSDSSLSVKQKNAAFIESQQLYERAKSTDPRNEYIYASWATAYFWRGEYAKAWDMINIQKSLGTEPSAKFLSMLAEKMPDPTIQKIE